MSFEARYNPHINMFVVYLLIQELFVDKIHFFKFLSMSDKPWPDQLKIITATRGTSFSESFHPYKGEEIPIRKGKCPMLRTNTKPQQLIKHSKISYSIASLVFRKFLCSIYRNGLNLGTSKLRHFRYLVLVW